MSASFKSLQSRDISVNNLEIHGVGNVGQLLLNSSAPSSNVRTDASSIVTIDVSDDIVFLTNANEVHLPHPSSVQYKTFKLIVTGGTTNPRVLVDYPRNINAFLNYSILPTNQMYLLRPFFLFTDI